ncbi:alpha/beta hydrolase [Oceaniserpentilla sp. 4NH20-0058]|uniref:alpha/beta hydrolase n=1 Tax=Oceaniserpentilla sp. 4NH20-0058 TaxID=3127660 RepID=UPI0031080D4D
MTLWVVLGVLVSLAVIVVLRPLWIMNYLAPRGHCKRIKDLPYARDSRHNLDIYVPKQPNSQDIIVFIHGGAWDTGHKNEYQFAGLALSEMGYTTVVPNYRLYPEVRFPQFIDDVAIAIASLPKHFTAQGISQNQPLNIILMGHSAGAHTAAMLTSDPQYLKQAGANVSIKATIGLAGPYDLPLDDPLVVGKFDGVNLHDISEAHIDIGHEHNAHEANPINLAHGNMPPVCLIHGEADETVGPYHSERFSKVLKRLQVPCEHITYTGTNHRYLVGGLSIFGRFLNPVFKDVKAFIQGLQHLND